MSTIITHSSEETFALGKNFSKILKDKDVVVLEGALGGGKTTFVKGILKEFGYRGKVLSPSFTLVREYKTRNFYIYHIDFYRVTLDKIFEMGIIEDYLYASGTITFIEWGQKIDKVIPSYIKIAFSYRGENSRKISFVSHDYDRERLDGWLLQVEGRNK